ncbi:hypothetical protein GCM10010964_13660 [Caldovatus sediminis]|uniref:Uncharacterized protein n=1 Tax=Caldovatus sediminis TaxID=2041189 RepID=A0A8J2Z9Q8_9PROT|nr:hypothetical protein [Caldovatus sediminis]GGG27020.1 hypothetical protein GCM10010964_13660 [Caldovatus sediminis]
MDLRKRTLSSLEAWVDPRQSELEGTDPVLRLMLFGERILPWAVGAALVTLAVVLCAVALRV